MQKTKNKKITINDIAKEAKVSKAAVSYVLNNKKGVSKEKENEIRKVIDKYGFSQSLYAKKITSNVKTNIIALILGTDTYTFLPYYAEFISYAIQEAKRNQKQIIVYFAESDKTIIDILKNQTSPIDGAIIDICLANQCVYDAINSTTLPIVTIGRLDSKLVKNTVYCDADNAACTYKLTRTILKRGFKKPALFDVVQSSSLSEDREKGFKKACKEYGVEGTILFAEATEETFYKKTSQLLDEGHDAIISVSTLFAKGTYKAIKERGLKIGKDIAVCALGYSFDKKSDHNPHITYAEQNWKQISINSVDLLCRLINNSKTKRHSIVKSKIHYQQSLLK